MVAAVATAAGRQPVVLGKPSKFMFEIVQKRHPGILPERTLMIGDRYQLSMVSRPFMSHSSEPTLTSYWVRTADYRLYWLGLGCTAWQRPEPGRWVRTSIREGWWRTFMSTSWGTSWTGSQTCVIKMLRKYTWNERLIKIDQVWIMFLIHKFTKQKTTM